MSNTGRPIAEMRVFELRQQLDRRGLNNTGMKNALIERLTNALIDEGVDMSSFLYYSDRSSRSPKENETPPEKEMESNSALETENKKTAEESTDAQPPLLIIEDAEKEKSPTISPVDRNESTKLDIPQEETDDINYEVEEIPIEEPKEKSKEKPENEITDTAKETSLWVSNVPMNVKASELKALFSEHGKVGSVKIFASKASKSGLSFGLVEMGNVNEAQTAKAKLNRSIFMEKTITVGPVPQRAQSSASSAHPPIQAPAVSPKSPPIEVPAEKLPPTFAESPTKTADEQRTRKSDKVPIQAPESSPQRNKVSTTSKQRSLPPKKQERYSPYHRNEDPNQRRPQVRYADRDFDRRDYPQQKPRRPDRPHQIRQANSSGRYADGEYYEKEEIMRYIRQKEDHHMRRELELEQSRMEIKLALERERLDKERLEVERMKLELQLQQVMSKKRDVPKQQADSSSLVVDSQRNERQVVVRDDYNSAARRPSTNSKPYTSSHERSRYRESDKHSRTTSYGKRRSRSPPRSSRSTSGYDSKHTVNSYPPSHSDSRNSRQPSSRAPEGNFASRRPPGSSGSSRPNAHSASRPDPFVSVDDLATVLSQQRKQQYQTMDTTATSFNQKLAQMFNAAVRPDQPTFSHNKSSSYAFTASQYSTVPRTWGNGSQSSNNWNRQRKHLCHGFRFSDNYTTMDNLPSAFPSQRQH